MTETQAREMLREMVKLTRLHPGIFGNSQAFAPAWSLWHSFVASELYDTEDDAAAAVDTIVHSELDTVAALWSGDLDALDITVTNLEAWYAVYNV